MKGEVEPASFELAFQLIDARLKDRAREGQRQIAQAQIEQFFVA
jgi:hypothetical protein